MKRILIISNRLPVNINIIGEKVNIEPSVGGLATGMSSVYGKYESKWILSGTWPQE